MYYVYEWFIVDTGEIIYVGKGKGCRYKVRYQRNKLLKKMFKEYECDSRIIKYFDNERDAFQYEYDRIKELKAVGLCKCNIHCGGAGGSGEYWTDELRKEYSDHNIMKEPDQRERMSKNNPMKNKSVSERVAKKKSRAVIIDGVLYQSVKEAAEAFLTNNGAIRNWCLKGVNRCGQLCRYADEPQNIYTGKRYNKGGSRPVIFCGVEYECVKDFAQDMGVSESVVNRWLKNGKDPRGRPVKYIDIKDEIDITHSHKSTAAHPIIVNGVFYNSLRQASGSLNISPHYLRLYLSGKYFNPNYICEYGNQQPSQANANN